MSKSKKKSKKPKFHHLYFEVLGANVYVIICSRQEYEKAILYEFGETAPKKVKTVPATFEAYKKSGIPVGVIWLKKQVKKCDIAHECMHAVHWILLDKGIWLTDSSEEIYAYMIGYIFKKIEGYIR